MHSKNSWPTPQVEKLWNKGQKSSGAACRRLQTNTEKLNKICWMHIHIRKKTIGVMTRNVATGTKTGKHKLTMKTRPTAVYECLIATYIFYKQETRSFISILVSKFEKWKGRLFYCRPQ